MHSSAKLYMSIMHPKDKDENAQLAKIKSLKFTKSKSHGNSEKKENTEMHSIRKYHSIINDRHGKLFFCKIQ